MKTIDVEKGEHPSPHIFSGVLIAVAGFFGTILATVAFWLPRLDSSVQFTLQVWSFGMTTLIGLGIARQLPLVCRFASELMLSLALLLLLSASASSVRLIEWQTQVDSVLGWQSCSAVMIGVTGLYALLLSLCAASDGLIRSVELYM